MVCNYLVRPLFNQPRPDQFRIFLRSDRLAPLRLPPTINTGGIGCLALPKAGLHDGFYDSCQNVHFDMWGRVMSRPTDQNLIVVPSTYVNDKAKIIFDLSNLPEVERP